MSLYLRERYLWQGNFSPEGAEVFLEGAEALPRLPKKFSRHKHLKISLIFFLFHDLFVLMVLWALENMRMRLMMNDIGKKAGYFLLILVGLYVLFKFILPILFKLLGWVIGAAFTVIMWVVIGLAIVIFVSYIIQYLKK